MGLRLGRVCFDVEGVKLVFLPLAQAPDVLDFIVEPSVNRSLPPSGFCLSSADPSIHVLPVLRGCCLYFPLLGDDTQIGLAERMWDLYELLVTSMLLSNLLGELMQNDQ